ncbi:MAG TPA: hypothetical protein VJ044_15670 [Candidatus Hodarchaeales archaeon]|nr:hypothetical protein [Candidatus Hodarchaeales archaeon]
MSLRTHYRGIIYCKVEDSGPEVVYNLTDPPLGEEFVFSTSVQAFTLLGMGSSTGGYYRFGNFPYGPLPTPTGHPLNTVIYSFFIEDKKSTDERVRASGRVVALIFLLTKQFVHYDRLRVFLAKRMAEWMEENIPRVSENGVRKLADDLRRQPFIYEDEQRAPSERTGSPVSGKEDSQVEFLKKLAEMENLSKALVTLYETSSNPTVSDLAKLAGMSKVILNWNLRKYVKQGILAVEDDKIRFQIKKG